MGGLLMKKLAMMFFRHARAQQGFILLRYCLVGVSNVFLDFVIYIGFTRGWNFWQAHYLWANLISFIVVVTWSFFCNKFWTFKDRSTQYHRQYLKFVLITVVGVTLYQSILYISVEYLLLLDLVAKLIAVPIMAGWNFLMHRFWTFRGNESSTASF